MSDSMEDLIKTFAILPGIGQRGARRIVLDLICGKSNSIAKMLSSKIEDTLEAVKICSNCRNIDEQDPCQICSDSNRDKDLLCVVQTIQDLWAIEKSGAFKGSYYVLGGSLCPTKNLDPESLGIDKFLSRMIEENIKEIILALNPTLDGQTTKFYIMSQLKNKLPNIKISSLAHGIPMGGELDYLDQGTLEIALNDRKAEY